MSNTMTIRLDSTVKDRLEQLAIATHRSKSFLAAEAIAEYIHLNEWQIKEIQTAIEEADLGNFASPADMDSLTSKWGVHAS